MTEKPKPENYDNVNDYISELAKWRAESDKMENSSIDRCITMCKVTLQMLDDATKTIEEMREELRKW